MPVLAQIKKTSTTEELYYCFNDDLGSKRASIKASTPTEVEYFEYTAFGEVIADNEENALFTGKQLDSTGLYYFNARYYDPEIKRFLTQDPSKQGDGWYTYCNNNPINLVDPDGRFIPPPLIDFMVKTAQAAPQIFESVKAAANQAIVWINSNPQIVQSILEGCQEGASLAKHTIQNTVQELQDQRSSERIYLYSAIRLNYNTLFADDIKGFGIDHPVGTTTDTETPLKLLHRAYTASNATSEDKTRGLVMASWTVKEWKEAGYKRGYSRIFGKYDYYVMAPCYLNQKGLSIVLTSRRMISDYNQRLKDQAPTAGTPGMRISLQHLRYINTRLGGGDQGFFEILKQLPRNRYPSNISPTPDSHEWAGQTQKTNVYDEKNW